MSRLQIEHLEPNHALAIDGPVLLQVWEGSVQCNAERQQRIVDMMRVLRQTSHSKQLLTLYIVGGRVAMPDPAARKVGAEMANYFDYAAGVFEGDSMRVSLTRGVITSMNIINGLRGRSEIFSNVEQAIAAVVTRAGSAANSARVRASVAELRDKARSLSRSEWPPPQYARHRQRT